MSTCQVRACNSCCWDFYSILNKSLPFVLGVVLTIKWCMFFNCNVWELFNKSIDFKKNLSFKISLRKYIYNTLNYLFYLHSSFQ